MIEEELELLYDSYYEELENMATDHKPSSPSYFSPSNCEHDFDEDDVDDIEDDFDDEYDESDDSGILEFGGSLRVKGEYLFITRLVFIFN